MQISSSPPPKDFESRRSLDYFLIIVSVIVIMGAVSAFAMYPARSEEVLNILFNGVTEVLSAPILVIFFVFVLAVFFIIFSKYGRIRLGSGAPQFKTAPWLFMFVCAGLSSATLYWGMVEWTYYYTTPGLNMVPKSQQALSMSLTYSFFHWGFGTWACYGIAGLAMSYCYHVRKFPALSLGGIYEAITGHKAVGVTGKIIDLCFLFGTIGGLTITLVVTTTTFSNGFSRLTGVPDTIYLQAGVVVLVASIFSLSSYIGLAGGMRRLASMVCIAVLVCAGVILVVGHTSFIVDNTISSIGFMFSHMVDMFLFTDPYGDRSFTHGWTAFFWFWCVAYTPAVGIFVARISKGRTLREVAAALLLGGSSTCWMIFGVFGSYSIDQFVRDVRNIPEIVMTQGGDVAINLMLSDFPLSTLATAVYLFIMIIFLASHVDAAAFTVAATTTRNLAEGEDPSPFLRLFWCVLVALIPLTMIYTKASLQSVKTAMILSSIPFVFFLILMAYGLTKWLRQDYGDKSAAEIEEEARQLAKAEA